MVHTVGISGVNGNVGAPATKYLVQAAKEGKLNLVIFHRAGTKPSGYDGANVSFRELSYEDSEEKILEAVKGVNTFISAPGFVALPREPAVVTALSKSKDLVTYIPSAYSTTFTKHDESDPNLGPVIGFVYGGIKKAQELGVGVTKVYSGCFDNYWFGMDYLGSSVRNNVVLANEKQLQNPFPITVLDHLGATIARVCTKDPQEIKNKSFSAVSFFPTGNDLIELYTKINGKKAEHKQYTNEIREEWNADGQNFGPGKVAYMDRWENGNFGYDQEGRVLDREYKGPGLEEIARGYLKN